jgi:hypothetical protein
MAEADEFLRGDTLDSIMNLLILDEDTLDDVFEEDLVAAMEVINYKKETYFNSSNDFL